MRYTRARGKQWELGSRETVEEEQQSSLCGAPVATQDLGNPHPPYLTHWQLLTAWVLKAGWCGHMARCSWAPHSSGSLGGKKIFMGAAKQPLRHPLKNEIWGSPNPSYITSSWGCFESGR